MRTAQKSPRTRLAAALAALLLVGVLATAPSAAQASAPSSADATPKPTIVLVHGAWADSSSWAPVTAILQAQGYTVLVAPNSLRSLSGDAAALDAFLAQQTSGPVVLVGHSYGGAVITDAGAVPNVKALVYVDAFIPDQGESLGSIIAGSTSALNVADPTSVFTIAGYPGAPAGDAEVYLKSDTFATAFAQDVPVAARKVLAAGQLPITLGALTEPSGAPAWDTKPSWAVVGTSDRVLPPATQTQMAQRAHARITTVDASHLSMVSHPLQVAAVIIQAAKSG